MERHNPETPVCIANNGKFRCVDQDGDMNEIVDSISTREYVDNCLIGEPDTSPGKDVMICETDKEISISF